MSGRDFPRPHPPRDEQYRQYFVSSWYISRHIIFSHIQFYLGPSAAVRPCTYRGREGYLVTSPSSVQPLTAVRFTLSLINVCRQSLSSEDVLSAFTPVSKKFTDVGF